jgi:hypothetical protein
MTTSLRRLTGHTVVLVLVLAGLADIVSGDPVAHGVALVAVAVTLAWQQVRSAPAEADADRPRRRFAVTPGLVILAVVYAALVGTFARFSWPLTIVVAIPGAAAVAFVWRGTPVETPPARPVGRGVLWAVVFVALGLWELQALLLQPSLTTSSWAHPTLSTLMDPILASHLGRSISLGAWLLIGGWLLER